MKYCGTYTLKSEPGAACLAFDESVLGRDKYPDSEGISSVIAKFEMAKNVIPMLTSEIGKVLPF